MRRVAWRFMTAPMTAEFRGADSLTLAADDGTAAGAARNSRRS